MPRPCASKHTTLQSEECLFCRKFMTSAKYRKIWRDDPLLSSLPPLPLHAMPSLPRRAMNYAKHVLKATAAGFPVVTQIERERRIEICKECPGDHYKNGICTHQSCGCIIRKKAASAVEQCPKGYWSLGKQSAQPATIAPVSSSQEIPPAKPLTWAYGVTTCAVRLDNLLPKTLTSLAQAGFDKPRLFVDGVSAVEWSLRSDVLNQYETTLRYPTIRSYGNWILALGELFIRNPQADRFAIFQDDLIASRNLRMYLETLQYPKKGYLNLYLFPRNEVLNKDKRIGIFPSNQRGLGAVALVFNKEAVVTLLSQQSIIERPTSQRRGWKAIDGGVVTGFRAAGWLEFVHYPSLIQHIGDESSMGNAKHAKALSFRGKDFDCMSLCQNQAVDSTPTV